MAEYFFDKQGSALLSDLCEAIEDLKAVTEQIAQYVAEQHDRDRYAFLDRVAHCCDYYTSTEDINRCFDYLSEGQRYKYFRF